MLSRLGRPPDLRFFTPSQEAIATALCDRLLDQDAGPSAIPVVAMIDARLAGQETDGWRYADLPEDGQAWRDTLRYLDDDARAKTGDGFARCPAADQRAIIQAVQDLGGGQVARPERQPGLEPVDTVRVHRVLRPPAGVGRDRLPRPRLPARIQEHRHRPPRAVRGPRHPPG